jgi:hypothetical protein
MAKAFFYMGLYSIKYGQFFLNVCTSKRNKEARDPDPKIRKFVA